MALRQPRWATLLPTGFVVGCATLGPLGKKLPAPGTWGSLAGLLYFLLFFARLPVFANLFVTALVSYLAVGLCGEAEVRLREKDPGKIVLDEVIAMPLCFLGWQLLTPAWPRWGVLLGGFALFRLFDIVKPFGIRRLQALPGGWGVVADDLAAALLACVALHGIAWLWTLR
jgi:phosphatidylglycerophosphatase A